MTSTNLLLANEIEDILSYSVCFATCVYLRGNLRVRLATQRKSLRKFKCVHLRLLSGPFGQGLKQSALVTCLESKLLLKAERLHK